MKKFVCMLFSVCLVVSFATCGTPATTTESASDKGVYELSGKNSNLDGKGLMVGCIFLNIENSVYALMKTQMEEQSKVWGNDFMFVTAAQAGDQITAVENMVDGGFDAIIMHLSEVGAIEPALEMAAAKGVKILAFDGESKSAVKSYVADNYNAGFNTGRLTGEWINENLGGKAKVGMFTYTKMAVLIERENGMRDGLAQTCPGAEIVISSEDFTISMGVSGTENFLQAVPDLDVIMSFNGSAALGAYQAFQAAGLNDEKHAIFAVDGAPEELLAIAENGCYRGTTSMGFSVLGYIMLGDAIKACRGMDTGNAVQLWPVETVTQANVQDYL